MTAPEVGACAPPPWPDVDDATADRIIEQALSGMPLAEIARGVRQSAGLLDVIEIVTEGVDADEGTRAITAASAALIAARGDDGPPCGLRLSGGIQVELLIGDTRFRVTPAADAPPQTGRTPAPL